MLGWRTGRFALALGLSALLFGCRSEPPAPYETFLDARPVPPIDTSRLDAYDWYASAALEAEQKAGDYAKWVSFPESDRSKIIAALGPALQKVARGTTLTCSYRCGPTKPFERVPYAAGWRLCGRALAWRIERALASGDVSAAIRDFLVATRFGFDLTAGDTTVASLGLAIVDEARLALLKGRAKLSAQDLRSVATGLGEALARVPQADLSMDCEAQQMLAAVDYVQDAYRAGSYDAIIAALGPEIRNATDALEAMRGSDAKQRPAYFRGFAQEAKERAKRMRQLAGMPAVERADQEPLDLPGDRPWRRFARHFFMAAEPYLAMRDRTLARTKLLLVECHALSFVKAGQPAPLGLSPLPNVAVTDPYTGAPLRYLASGSTFRAYSVGPNFADDGGESGEDGESPDLVLESG